MLVRVIRPHGDTSDYNQELVADLGDLVITQFDFSEFRRPLVVLGKLVADKSYHALLFEFFSPPIEIMAIWNLDGKLTGYYCNIIAEPSRVEGGYEVLDLYLDVFVLPDLTYEVLDEDEFEVAIEKGWIDEDETSLARETVRRVILDIESGEFPPEVVRDWIRSLSNPEVRR